MPRKKKEEKKTEDDYQVMVGFIKEFDYVDPGSLEQMNGHPIVGKCYRIIKDTNGYRLHIGREFNSMALDGLWLGDSLAAERKDFSYDIQIVTPENFLDLPIDQDEAKKVSEWIEANHEDIWVRLRSEITGDMPVIKTLQDLLSYMATKREDAIDLPAITASIPIEAYDDVTRLENAINIISGCDSDLMDTLIDVAEYLASTYGDKYESPEMPNIGKIIVTQSATLGKGANVFNMIKYAQRYGTTGFDKSENPRDLMKVIHYAMFEMQRKRNINGNL